MRRSQISQVIGAEEGNSMPLWERALSRLVMRPGSKTRLGWTLIGVFLIMIDLIWVPFQAFDPPVDQFSEVSTWIPMIYWTLDIPCAFLTGFNFEGAAECRPRLIA